MDERGRFIAALLDSGARAHGAGVATRVLERNDAAARYARKLGFGALSADVELRVRHLAESLAVGRPELFRHDVEWLAATHAARGVPAELLNGVLRALRAELGESLPADCIRQVGEHLDAGVAALNGRAAPQESLLAEESPHVDLARRFLLALLEGRRAEAMEMVLEAFENGVSLADLHQHVIARVQAEVGRMWQVGELHVAEEHLGSKIVEEILVVLRSRMPVAPPNGRTVIVTSAPTCLHDLGARMVADHFEMAGWNALYLGADVPVDSLAQAVADFGADLVAISCSTSRAMRSTEALVCALHEAGVPVLVGGRPFLAIEGLWRDLGADGSAADPVSAVRVGAELVGA